jgi:YesN/AraC family two-component response regulator
MNKQISVVIVDDDEAILDSLKTGLSLQGYDCETATNGKSALELIRNTSFEVMITDFDMPHMNGLELTKRVKELKPDMKVIVIIGYSEKFSHDEAIALGVSDLLEKPFGFRELINKIKDIKI